jgi:hypothetical protein
MCILLHKLLHINAHLYSYYYTPVHILLHILLQIPVLTGSRLDQAMGILLPILL